METSVQRFESISEPLDDEELILMDPDTWDWENAEEGEPVTDLRWTFEVRLAGEDLDRIERAAAAEGMTINAFLKHAALQRALEGVPG